MLVRLTKFSQGAGRVYDRIPPIYEKLSDQFVYWAKFRYTPKGQLGKIL